MATENSFFTWGENGSKLTPEQIAIAKQLLARKKLQGADTSPVQHWSQGAARVADALSDVVQERRLGSQEKENNTYNSELISSLLGSSGATPAAVIPSPGATSELSGSSPAPVAMPTFANDGTELGGYLSDPARRSTLPAGMRNNNPGNIKFVGQKVPGIVGPSENTDQGDPQAVFATPEAGMQAMYQLALRKYQGGKVTPNQLIAGNMGWTPGNTQAAANVARSMGIGPDDDIRLTDPAMATKFIRGLILQEHGQKGALYPESMIASSIGGIPQPTSPAPVAPVQVASAQPQTATDAIEAVAPQQPSSAMAYADPQATDYQQATPQSPVAPMLPSPTTIAAAPPVASVPPVEVAQAAPPMAAPVAPQGIGNEALVRALTSPQANESTRRIAGILLQQQQARQQAILQQQLQQNDPKYRQDLEKGNLELQNLRAPKMSPAEQAADARDREKMAFEHEKFDAEVKKGQWQKLTDGRLYNQTSGEFRDAPPPAPGSVTPKFDDVSGMRKEIQQLPAYKNLAAAAPIYKSMAETAGRDSKASDLNLVYGLGKIMDPTSVVREGEMIMVKNTASLPDWLQGAISSLNGGAALTPETRKAIMTEAYGRVKGYNDEFQQNMGQYQGIVQRNGINPADVIPEVDKFEPWAPPAATGPVQIKNVDDYNGLPKGTQYLDPNGKLRTKQ